ncbi:inositol hexakisphosphate and diphosphoinositol-pentakisphosphate kinase, partial [Kickxella alabastrina]
AERRVHSTLTAYMGAFFNNSDFAHRVTVRSDMLDDSALAKAGMEAVRTRIRGLFNFDGPLEYNPYYDPEFMRLDDMGSDPKAFLRSMCSVMSRLVARMEQNFSDLGSAQLAELQPDWCCNENAELFRERWKKIMDDFQSTDKQGNIIYDPAKVGAVYDSLKYDALHNRRFLERIFMTPEDLATEIRNMAARGESAANTDEAKAVEYSNHSGVDGLDEDAGAGRLAQLDIAGDMEDDESVSDDFIEISSNTDPIDIPQRSIQRHRNSPAVGSPATAQTLHSHNAPPIYPPDPLFTQKEVRQLYHKARQLFDFVTPLEFGIQPQERRRIGIQASIPLLRQLILDLQSIRTGPNPRTRFYFTKESHMHTLLNLVFICGLPTVVPYAEVGELDYLTHVIFEVYERKSDVDANLEGEYSLRVGFSPGASCVGVLDINVDSTHALK